MNQVVEMEVGPLTITPTDLRVKCLLPVSSTLYSAGLETLVLEGSMYFHQETPKNSIELEVKTVAQPLWVPHASKAMGKKGSYGVGWGD